MTPGLSMDLRELLQTVWAPDQPTTTPAAPLTPAPRTVLAIDDDAMLLELMYVILSAAGFNVLTTTRAAKGLEMLRQTPGAVDVVLLDYQMPVLTGAQVLPAVRELVPAAKVLGVSGTDPADLPAEFREGVDQLLRKPFSGRELIATVTALVPAEPPVTKRGRELRPIRAAAGRPIASVPATRQP